MTTTLMRDLAVERAGVLSGAEKQTQKRTSGGFASALRAEGDAAPSKQELLEVLSERSRNTVELMKRKGSMEKDEWVELLEDLLGNRVITEEEFDWTAFDVAMAPHLLKKDGARNIQWTGDPMEDLQRVLLELKKERALRELEFRDQVGSEVSAVPRPTEQEDACEKVLNLLRLLLA